MPNHREKRIQVGAGLRSEVLAADREKRRKSRGKLERNLNYWLENLEKKFVYNLCFDEYGMSRDDVNTAIERYGLQNVRLSTKDND